MRKTKIFGAILLSFIAVKQVLDISKANEVETIVSFEKLTAFLISAGLAVWLIYSANKKK